MTTQISKLTVMETLRAIALSVLFAGSVNFASAAQLTLQPGPTGDDVWITSFYSYGDDYGVNDSRLRVGGWGDLYYSLLRFDVTALPATIDSATLWLYDYSNDSANNVSMYLHRPTSPWNEDTGWFTQPSTVFLRTLPAPVLQSWYSIDVTDLYTFWKANPASNFGLQLRPTSVNHEFNEFYSSDYTVDPSLRPKLIINYAANQPPIANAGPNQTIECAGAPQTVILDGSASTDADGDPLTYQWFLGQILRLFWL